MNASDLDKEIKVYLEVTTTNEVGTPTETYSHSFTTWSNVKYVSGGTEYSGYGALPYSKTIFTIRYNSDLNYKCKVEYEDQWYEIQHIKNIARKGFQEIETTVWEDE